MKNIINRKLSIKSLVSFIIWYLLIIIFLIIIILLILFCLMINFEKKGINNKPLGVSFDVYILNNETNEENISSFLAGANKIWENYNISISLNLIKNVHKDISDNETRYVFESSNCSLISPIINNLLENSNNLSIIFMSNKNSTIEGRGCICNCTFLVVDVKKGEFSSWNLAHEIGHILNAEKSCWKWNLMTETTKDCYNNFFIKFFQEWSFVLRKTLKPEFLNQNQVNNVTNKVLNFSPKNI